MPQHPECRYCDSGFYARRVDDDLVCSSCGAEWNPIMVEDEEDEDFPDFDHFDDDCE